MAAASSAPDHRTPFTLGALQYRCRLCFSRLQRRFSSSSSSSSAPSPFLLLLAIVLFVAIGALFVRVAFGRRDDEARRRSLGGSGTRPRPSAEK